jgi:lysophospholipid acyltransferase (LPLAT)-like uncharacterized protein
MGIATVRGSSSKLGREAVTTLIQCLKSGNDIGITPDGPRGPCYDFKAGSLIVTRRTQSPLILVGAQFESKWQLHSWDKFIIPKPFSEIHLDCELISPASLQTNRDEATHVLRERLLKINVDQKTNTVI